MPVGFGKKIREAERIAKTDAKKKYKCPSCSRIAVQRISSAIWQCEKCRMKFASGTFKFKL